MARRLHEGPEMTSDLTEPAFTAVAAENSRQPAG